VDGSGRCYASKRSATKAPLFPAHKRLRGLLREKSFEERRRSTRQRKGQYLGKGDATLRCAPVGEKEKGKGRRRSLSRGCVDAPATTPSSERGRGEDTGIIPLWAASEGGVEIALPSCIKCPYPSHCLKARRLSAGEKGGKNRVRGPDHAATRKKREKRLHAHRRDCADDQGMFKKKRTRGPPLSGAISKKREPGCGRSIFCDLAGLPPQRGRGDVPEHGR